jgi:hypothetical protein
MSAMGRILDALRDTVLLNERVERLGQEVAQLNAGNANLRDRVTRIEALIEFAAKARLPRGTQD